MMQKSEEIKKELESISPRMAEIPREEIFPLPDDYFKDLPGEVQLQIRDKYVSGKKVKEHVFGPTTLKWMAASIAILILGSAYYYKAWKTFNPGNYTNTESYVIENIDEATISEYLTEISVSDDQNIEIIDNSLETIDEEIFIEEL